MLLQSSLDLMNRGNAIDLTVGVGILRRLSEQNLDLPESHAIRLVMEANSALSTDAFVVLKNLGSRAPALAPHAFNIHCEELEAELSGNGDPDSARFEACCASLCDLLLSSPCEFEVGRLFHVLELILDPRRDWLEYILDFFHPIKALIPRGCAVPFLNAAIASARRCPNDWKSWVEDIAEVLLAFVCERPTEVQLLTTGEQITGARLIVDTMCLCLKPDSYFEDVCSASRLFSGLIQSGNVTDGATMEQMIEMTNGFLRPMSDGDEATFRFHCAVQVFASLVIVEDFDFGPGMIEYWLRLIEMGLFATAYLRLLCAFALPRLSAALPNGAAVELHGRIVANAIASHAHEVHKPYHAVFDAPWLGVMPIESRKGEVEGFVDDTQSAPL
jgi:hypothetical protein